MTFTPRTKRTDTFSKAKTQNIFNQKVNDDINDIATELETTGNLPEFTN